MVLPPTDVSAARLPGGPTFLVCILRALPLSAAANPWRVAEPVVRGVTGRRFRGWHLPLEGGGGHRFRLLREMCCSGSQRLGTGCGPGWWQARVLLPARRDRAAHLERRAGSVRRAGRSPEPAPVC